MNYFFKLAIKRFYVVTGMIDPKKKILLYCKMKDHSFVPTHRQNPISENKRGKITFDTLMGRRETLKHEMRQHRNAETSPYSVSMHII